MGVLSYCALSTKRIKRGDKMAISLKAARINAKLKRSEVIARLKDEFGITKSINTLANYENDKSKSTPDINTGKALAAIYGKSVDDIIFL